MDERKRRKKRSALYAPVSFIIIIAALAFGMSVFFKINNIEVVGNSIYTDEEIIEASGLEKGDNLFLTNTVSAMSRLNSRLPYVETSKAERRLPNTIVIEVTESAAIACIESESGLWSVDKSCKVLSQVSNEDAASLIRIKNLTAIAPSVGDTVRAGENESARVSFLASILNEISTYGIQRDISYIDMENIASPSFDYLGRFTVKLGGSENVSYKFQLLISAVSKMGDGDSGTIDLSIDNRAHLIYN